MEEPAVGDSQVAGIQGPITTIPREPKLGLGQTVRPALALADYVDTSVEVPPAVARPHGGFQWGMLANDRLGDCVIAMMLHSLADFHLDAGTDAPALTDTDAVRIYSAITGYDPQNPDSDQGADEGQAMAYWQDPGLTLSDGSTHRIAGTLSVDPQNLDLVRRAIWEDVALQIAVLMPVSAQGQTQWDVVGDPAKDQDSRPGSWGGHGVPAREYDSQSFKVVTWGAELLMTVAFWQAYVVEAHVVVSEEMLDRAGLGPAGIAWADMVADLGKYQSRQEGDAQEGSGSRRPREGSERATQGDQRDAGDTGPGQATQDVSPDADATATNPREIDSAGSEGEEYGSTGSDRADTDSADGADDAPEGDDKKETSS